jgi:HSP20 family protein
MAETTLKKNEGNGLVRSDESRGLTYTPRVDILETEDELLMHADLPGVREGDIDIRFENGEMTLHARRNATQPAAVQTWLWESEPGDFFREFRINERIDSGKIWAELKNGVLSLHMPKVEAAKPRKITVKAG